MPSKGNFGTEGDQSVCTYIRCLYSKPARCSLNILGHDAPCDRSKCLVLVYWCRSHQYLFETRRGLLGSSLVWISGTYLRVSGNRAAAWCREPGSRPTGNCAPGTQSRRQSGTGRTLRPTGSALLNCFAVFCGRISAH